MKEYMQFKYSHCRLHTQMDTILTMNEWHMPSQSSTLVNCESQKKHGSTKKEIEEQASHGLHSAAADDDADKTNRRLMFIQSCPRTLTVTPGAGSCLTLATLNHR